MANTQDATSDNTNPHTLVRKATNLETYYYMLTLTGSQSTIVVSADYASLTSPSKLLTKPALLHAVSTLVQSQPALSIVFSRQPTTKSGKSEGWLARLPTINVEECIEFWDITEEELATRSILPRIYDAWIDPSDSTHPLWKVYVVNNQKVYFSWVHIICDGRGGQIFHQQLLRFLNDYEESLARGKPLPHLDYKRVPTSNLEYRSVIVEEFVKTASLSFLPFLYEFLVHLFAHYVLSSWIVFGSLPRPVYQPTMEALCPSSDRLQNKVVVLRIPPSTLSTILASCRTNSTTLTAFFDVLFNTSLCANVYPSSKVQLTAIVADLRLRFPNIYTEGRNSIMCNASTSVSDHHLAAPFAAVGRNVANNNPEVVTTDVKAFWELTRVSKEGIIENLGWRSIQRILTLDFAPKHVEDYAPGFYKNLAVMTNFSLYLSNLGVLKEREEDKGREWKFVGGEWCSSTLRGHIGPGLNVCIGSTEEGGCVVNTVVDGKVEGAEEMAGKLAVVMRDRIGQVLGEKEEGWGIQVVH